MTDVATHIAQMNWGILKADWDDPLVADFVDNLDRVNAIAMRSPGFVWRMDDDNMESAQLEPEGVFGGNPRLASTMSVWMDDASLDHFVHNTVHGAFISRADQWFERNPGPRYVIWPVPVGHRPGLGEAKDRLNHLAAHGASPVAYDFNFLRSRQGRTEAA